MSERRCARCDFQAEDLREHAQESQHWLCVVCYRSLRLDETQTCQRCVTRCRGFLNDIGIDYAMLPDVAEHAGYRSLPIPGGDAVVMSADGNFGGSYTPCDDLRFGDPQSVLAELEVIERDWRHEFGHGPADDVATVAGCLGYLTQWLWLAARTHPGFDDTYREMRGLRSSLAWLTATSETPKSLPASCFDCGEPLIRDYRDPVKAPEARAAKARKALEESMRPAREQHDAEASYGVPEEKRTPIRPTIAALYEAGNAKTGTPREGLSDVAICAGCGGEYDTESYGLALRQRVAETRGWVSVKLAAETSRRPEPTIWRWLRDGMVNARCIVETKRIEVEWDSVKSHDTLMRERRKIGTAAA